MDSLSLKCHNSFQNQNNTKVKISFAPRPLISRLKQEASKFNDICVSWCSPKTDLKMNFLNLEKNKVLRMSVFLIVTK